MSRWGRYWGWDPKETWGAGYDDRLRHCHSSSSGAVQKQPMAVQHSFGSRFLQCVDDVLRSGIIS